MPSLRFLARHFWPFGVQVPDSDLTGLTAIITGATSGLGYATAQYFVEHGISTLVIGCRDVDKGKQAKEKLLQLAPNKEQCEIHVWELDLASFESVIAFHKQCQQLQDIHIFIANAGVAPGEDWKLTGDGWEQSFQINVLATGMLAHLILGDMANTGDAPEVRMKPHMVFVGAADHYDVEFAQKDAENVLKTLNDPSSYPDKESRPYELFKIEKLFTIFIAKELAMLPAASNININVCCPGYCNTNLLQDERAKLSWISNYVFSLIAWSPSYGSRAIVWSALSDTKSGAYIEDGKEVEPLAFINTEQGQELQQKVWEELLRLWVIRDPENRLIEATAS